MEIVTKNPYRVLGMFTDDPIKVRMANIARIRAFAKVGKTYHFACDNVDFFGEVDRSEEAIENALSQLSNSNEAKAWQLFWINSSWLTDEGIERTSPSIKVYLNKAVMSLMDYQRLDYAAKHFSFVFNKRRDDLTLFDDSCFWENENEKIAVSKCFLDILIPDLDSDYQSFNPYAIGGWFWWFRNYLNKDNCLRKALNDKYKGFAFERIGYLTETHDNINAFHLKYRKLHWLATRCFQILDGVIMDDSESEKNNCSYEIKIIKDKFAYSLLEFCKEIYDRAKYWEASKLMDMIMFINEEVRSLACSYSTLNTIDTSLEVLNDQIPYLAPEECKDEALKIRKLIEEFCEEQDLVRFSLSLIKQCVAPLIRIKDILGDDNIYYRHISTKIADNAIYSAEIDLASAEEMYYNPDNDKQLAKVHLRATICQCILLIRNIEQYNLADKFLQGKFLSFKTHIMGMTKKYGIDANRIQPDISLIPEEIEFMACGDDYEKLCKYIKTHTDGKFHEQAIAKVYAIEDAAWPTEITIPNLFEYKRKFPNSHNDNKIIMLLNRLIWNSNNGNSIPNFQTLLQLFPNHPHKQKILLRIEFLVYDQCFTISDYQEYLKKYPKGKYVIQVKESINELEKKEQLESFAQCKTIADYQNFIHKYPKSELCTQAYQRIEELRREQDLFTQLIKICPIENINQTVEQFLEKDRIQQEAEEKRRFEACKKTSDFKAYIKDYPNGKYLDKANASIQKHYSLLWITFIFVLIFLLVLSIFCFATNADPSSKDTENIVNQSESQVSQTEEKQREKQHNEIKPLEEVKAVNADKSNLSKFYEAFSAEYTIFNSEEFMAEWLRTADDDLITRIYYLFSAKYSWFKDEKEMRQYLGLPPKIVTKNKISSSNSNPDEKWINNRLSTGSRPYSRHFGRPLSGDNEFHFKTSIGSDYVIIIKRYYDGGYVDHKYVCGGDQITIKVPDGTYIVFFYSGKGGNPNKSMGKCTGGFVSGESFQKDGPVKMTTTIKGDYSYNNRCEYTLYPVNNGNLNLKSTNQNEIFN